MVGEECLGVCDEGGVGELVVEDRPDWSVGSADVVEILAVAPWSVEPEHVEARAAAYHELISEQQICGDLDHEAHQDQVLFDLVAGIPWHAVSPVLDVGGGERWSEWMSPSLRVQSRVVGEAEEVGD